jgi:hypothetical protein
MEADGSLPCSQAPSTGPCPEADQFSPYHPSYLSSVLILPSHPYPRRPSGPFPSGSLTKILHRFSFASMRATCPAHLILLDLIVPKATNQHATTEELLEAVFSVVHAATVATQQRGKHASTTEERFPTWSVPKGYEWDTFRA